MTAEQVPLVATPQVADSSAPESAVRRWWRVYCGPEAYDRGTRARLKRCRSTREALYEKAAIALPRWTNAILPGAKALTPEAIRMLDLTRVLVHVREDDRSLRPMQAAGWKEFPGDRKEADIEASKRPKLSQVRFRRLLTTDGGEDLVRAFIRLIALLDGKVNVEALGRDFRDWGHPSRGEAVRQRWAFDYYAASSANPAATDAAPLNQGDN